MTTIKISDLPAASTLTSGDLIPVVANTAGLPSTKKISLSNFYSNVIVTAKFANSVTFTTSLTANNLYINYRTTPTSSTDSVTQGKVWFDNSYIYVATANNTIKRVAISTF